jgi:phage tail sheath gpL-like
VEFCIGIIILTIVTVGGILVYAQFAAAAANRKRIEWARTLNNLTLPELEKMLYEVEKRKKILQRESLLVSGYKRDSLNAELSEFNVRIKILESFIDEQRHGK